MRRTKIVLILTFAASVSACGSESTVTSPATSTPATETAAALPPQEGLPPAAEATRQAIHKAATERDYGTLRKLVPDSGFTYSYGQTGSGGAVGYWRRLEAQGERPFDTMAALLELPYTRSEAAYAWPRAYDKNPADLSPDEIDRLAAAGAATKEQLEQMAGFGHYLGWRLGIRPDGTWIFFVAGD